MNSLSNFPVNPNLLMGNMESHCMRVFSDMDSGKISWDLDELNCSKVPEILQFLSFLINVQHSWHFTFCFHFNGVPFNI